MNSEYQIKSYWEDEQFVYDEEKLEEISKSGIKITKIVTHSAPSICPPTTKNDIQLWLEADKDLESDLDEERKRHDQLLDYAKRHFRLESWYYGHFHFLKEDNNENKIEGVNFSFLPMICHANSKFYYSRIISNENEEKKEPKKVSGFHYYDMEGNFN